jgi:hypothetical protein
MKGLTMVGVLVSLALVGYLMARSLTATSPVPTAGQDPQSAPQGAIDQANQAVDQLQDATQNHQTEPPQ